jgi:adenosylmethionine-8-amino-7-oxononanoate aminotransferase
MKGKKMREEKQMKFKEETLRRWDLKHFWHPYTQMNFYKKIKPPIICKGEGNWIIDINGKKYLDAVSSIWCVLHGHSKPELVKGIVSQAKILQHSTTLGLANIPSILLAKELSGLVGLPKVFFSEDGAEAVEIAIKMAFSFAKRNSKKVGNNNKKIKFACVKNAYHGDTLGAMSISGKTQFTKEYSQLLFSPIELPPVLCFRCGWNRAKEKGERICSFECMEKAREILRKKRPSAVFVEGGVQGAGGIIPLPPGYLKMLREETKKIGALLVVDEVATGFGKTGKMFGFEWELKKKQDELPDIVCLGKGLSGGYLPLAATLAKDEIFKVFLGEQWEGKHFFHGHTFTGNPILCNLALESVRLFKKENILEKIQDKISYLEKRLSELWDLEFVGDIRGKGFMWGIEIVKKGKESFPPRFLAGWRVCLSMWKKGVFIRPLGDVVVINLPLSIKTKEIDFLLEALKESISELKKFTKI